MQDDYHYARTNFKGQLRLKYLTKTRFFFKKKDWTFNLLLQLKHHVSINRLWIIGCWEADESTCDIADALNRSQSQVTRAIKAFKIKLLLLSKKYKWISFLFNGWVGKSWLWLFAKISRQHSSKGSSCNWFKRKPDKILNKWMKYLYFFDTFDINLIKIYYVKYYTNCGWKFFLLFLRFVLILHEYSINNYERVYIYIWEQTEQHFLSSQDVLKHCILK